MDAEFFKRQSRKVGVTTEDLGRAIGRDRSVISRIYAGDRPLKPEEVEPFATLLGISTDEVLERAGIKAAAVVRAMTQPGFAESDAAPWIGKGAEDRIVPTIAEALGARPGIDIWRINSSAMAVAGYLPGDFMLVDTHLAERVKPGDVVVAQVYARGDAKTVLRRWQPPVLVPAAPHGEDDQIYVVDNDNVAIRGKVTASWRLG